LHSHYTTYPEKELYGNGAKSKQQRSRTSKLHSRQTRHLYSSTTTGKQYWRQMPPIGHQEEYYPSTMTKDNYTQSLSFPPSIRHKNAIMRFTIKNSWQLLKRWRNGAPNSRATRMNSTLSRTIKTSSISCQRKYLIRGKSDGRNSYPSSTFASHIGQDPR
jgi:hypothetical protein